MKMKAKVKTKIFLSAVTIVFFPFYISSQTNALVPKADPAMEMQIKEINEMTSKLQNKIDSSLLYPYLTSGMVESQNPSEGVPPEMTFYFNEKNEQLIAVKAHVGHEVWGTTYYYFFNEKEKIIKYLTFNSASKDIPEIDKKRYAIIYNPEGKIIWKNTETAKIEPEKVLKLYKLLSACNNGFGG